MTNANQELYEAAAEGDISKMQEAIDNGADDFKLALKHAAKNNEDEAIDFLIKKMITFSEDESSKQNLLEDELREAAEIGDIAKMQTAIDRGAIFLDTSLCCAASYGQIEATQFLIDKGAKELNLALREAVEEGEIEVIKLLIEKGADGLYGALQRAVENKNIQLIELLIKYIKEGKNENI